MVIVAPIMDLLGGDSLASVSTAQGNTRRSRRLVNDPVSTYLSHSSTMAS